MRVSDIYVDLERKLSWPPVSYEEREREKGRAGTG